MLESLRSDTIFVVVIVWVLCLSLSALGLVRPHQITFTPLLFKITMDLI